MKLLHAALAFGCPVQPVGQYALGRAASRPRWQLALGYLVLTVSTALFVTLVKDPGEWWSDFSKAYYPAGRLVLSAPRELYAGRELGFVNLPLLALPFVPLSWLGLPAAQLGFAALGILVVAAACWLVLRLTGATGSGRLAILGLFALNGPLYYSFREGNLTHYVLVLLAAALLCLEKKREYGAGALLAVAALIKIPLLLFGVYYLLRRRWRILAGFTVVVLLLGGASLLLFGLELHLYWFHQCIAPYSGKPMTAHNVQSLSSFLARLLTDSSISNWAPLEVGPGFRAAHLALVGLVAATAGWACWAAPRRAGPEVERLEFCITLCLALVTSPISWSHYYLFLILPFALYLGDGLAVPRGPGWLAVMALALSLTTPPSAAFGSSHAWGRLAFSHYLYGGLLLLGTLLAARRRLPAQVDGARGQVQPVLQKVAA